MIIVNFEICIAGLNCRAGYATGCTAYYLAYYYSVALGLYSLTLGLSKNMDPILWSIPKFGWKIQ